MASKTTTTGKRKRVSDVSGESEAKRPGSNVPFEETFGELTRSNIPDSSEYLVSEITPAQRCDPSKLSTGSMVYRPARIEILGKQGNMFEIKNQETGETWNLASGLIGTQCYSPDQYTRIEKVTQTEIAGKLKEEVGDCVCKVEFFKLPDPTSMAQMIRDGSKLIEESGLTEIQKARFFKKLFERSQLGEYRVMRGYIARSSDQQTLESETGMLKFIDAEALAKGEFPMRQINLRNIQALTFKLVRYELK